MNLDSLSNELIALYRTGVISMCDRLDQANLDDMQLMSLWNALPNDVRTPLRQERIARLEEEMRASRKATIYRLK